VASLTEAEKVEIVTRLACFESPADVRADFAERGRVLTASQLAYYDPTNARAANLATKWRTLFETTRAAYVSDVSSVAVAHRAHRLRRIGDAAERFARMGNVRGELDALEQAAKEMGGAYEGRRRVTGTLATPARLDWDALTDAQVERLARGEPVEDVAPGLA
jgi:hypothetical protein